MDGSDRVRAATTPTGEWPDGWTVRHLVETGSTNADLIDALDSGAELGDRTVLVTDHQIAGRGRLDRTWNAPPGSNLLVSLLFTDVPADPGELTRRVGLAAIDACRAVADVDARLKWPNDVLVDGRKLAGILAQRASTGAVVVGIGLNVGWAPEGAAKLGAHRPLDVLAAMLRAWDALPADVAERYRAALDTIGRRVRVELHDDALVGTATGVEPDGRLVVLDDCAITHRIAVGDVVHLRPA